MDGVFDGDFQEGNLCRGGRRLRLSAGHVELVGKPRLRAVLRERECLLLSI